MERLILNSINENNTLAGIIAILILVVIVAGCGVFITLKLLHHHKSVAQKLAEVKGKDDSSKGTKNAKESEDTASEDKNNDKSKADENGGEELLLEDSEKPNIENEETEK